MSEITFTDGDNKYAWDSTVPDWIKTVSTKEMFNENLDSSLSELNFLKGAYWGHAAHIAALKDELLLANERADLMSEYQREVDARLIERDADAYKGHGTTLGRDIATALDSIARFIRSGV